MNVNKTKGGVTAPTGFLAAGIHAGIKPAPLLDLALLVSTHPGIMAGVFSKNRLIAAPVLLGRRQLKKHTGQAIIVNSGNANSLTGSQGMSDALEMRKLAATVLRFPVSSVFVGSTGVIGRPLPMPVIRQALSPLTRLLSRSGHKSAAQAIMTTDTIHKEVALQAKIGRRMLTIGGMAKGSGMIHPNMATMLAYLTTDASIAPQAFQVALTRAVNDTFNCISVDGDSSTNDTVLCLANGCAGNPAIQMGTPQWEQFSTLLYEACLSLALQICRDGEGADFQNVEVQDGKAELDHAGDELGIGAKPDRMQSHPLAGVRTVGEASLQLIRRPEATAQRGGRGAKTVSVGR